MIKWNEEEMGLYALKCVRMKYRKSCCLIRLRAQFVESFRVPNFYLIVKPLIWSEAEGDLVVIETSI